MPDTAQHPRVTLAWALRGLEVAIQKLGDGPDEGRVRRQFHQLVLAIERHSSLTEAEPGADLAGQRDAKVG